MSTKSRKKIPPIYLRHVCLCVTTQESLGGFSLILVLFTWLKFVEFWALRGGVVEYSGLLGCYAASLSATLCWSSNVSTKLLDLTVVTSRSRWPRGLRRRTEAPRLLRLWVRNPPGTWMSVCFVVSEKGLCGGLITRLEVRNRLWCVVVCDLETCRMRRPSPTLGRSATKKLWLQCVQHNRYFI